MTALVEVALSAQTVSLDISLDVQSRDIEVSSPTPASVEVVLGAPSTAGFISADPDNRTKIGADGGIFTPDIAVDPLAYYILAKA